MKGAWQVMALSAAVFAPLHADEARAIVWEPVPVVKPFTPALTMMDAEREEYAGHLATLAGNRIVEAQASPAALEEARRLVGLALHLSPRNKRALVLNFQLAQGTLPEKVAGDLSPQALARLLHTRGSLLAKQPGEENLQVSRMFTQLAARLDPRNEDAVYASELQRIDMGEIDWETMTGPDKP